MDEQGQGEAPRRRIGFNWLGVVAFIVIAFGRRIVGFVQWLFAGGTALLPGSFDLGLVLAGGAVVAVVVAAVVTLRASRRADVRGPALPPVSRAPASPGPTIGAAARVDAPAERLYPAPNVPRFEPIISGKAALASLVLTLGLAGALAAFLLVRP